MDRPTADPSLARQISVCNEGPRTVYRATTPTGSNTVITNLKTDRCVTVFDFAVNSLANNQRIGDMIPVETEILRCRLWNVGSSKKLVGNGKKLVNRILAVRPA